MRFYKLLTPAGVAWSMKNAWHGAIDKLLGRPIRPLQTVAYVSEHARAGDAQSVLDALDRFALEERWLMSVGPEKKQVMRDIASRLPGNPKVLEFGAYCGYSSIMIAETLGAQSTVTSVEISEDSVQASRANIAVAGLSDRITFIHSGSSQAIPSLQGPYDLVFLDHWKPLYLGDLKLIEEHGLIGPGSVVVADNVGEFFGAEEYLNYVRSCGKYDCEHRTATIEYTQIPDAVEISVHR